MPEKLPVQEHIKESRKRLKEMQKANGLSSSTRIYHFVTPADMIEMDAVIDILHHDIGDIVVFIGSKQYEVSKQ